MAILEFVWEILKVVFTPIFICFVYFIIYTFLLSILASKNALEQTAFLCVEYSNKHRVEDSPNNRLNGLRYYAVFFLPFILLNLYIYVTIAHNTMLFLSKEVLDRTDILLLFILILFYRSTYRLMAKEYDIRKAKKLSPATTISYVYFKDALMVMGNILIIFNTLLLLYPPIMQYFPDNIFIDIITARK